MLKYLYKIKINLEGKLFMSIYSGKCDIYDDLIAIREMKDSSDLYTENLLSFPSDKPKKRIDYIFVSPDVEFVSADIPAIVAADHRPAVAEIK